ncbi:hypothetical protein ULG90_11075 [Halopseudomonas pachastrellae]|nr:hypothetical protein ULG90_11075 [Halopseudomonas pachastrellae]
MKRLLGYTPSFMLSSASREVLADARFDDFMSSLRAELREQVHAPERIQALRRQGYHPKIVFDCIKADGLKCPLEVRVSLMWSPQGRFLGLLGFGAGHQ